MKVIILSILFCVSSISAEMVLMKNGKEYRGTIENQNIHYIVLNIRGNNIKINKSEIAKIIFGNFGQGTVSSSQQQPTVKVKKLKKVKIKKENHSKYQEDKLIEQARRENLMRLFDKQTKGPDVEILEEVEETENKESEPGEKVEILTNNVKK